MIKRINFIKRNSKFYNNSETGVLLNQTFVNKVVQIQIHIKYLVGNLFLYFTNVEH